jgi:hypothetical protein
MPRSRAWSRCLPLAFVMLGATAAGAQSEVEPYFPAAALVAPPLLSGPNFRVVPEVQVRGYMAHFIVDTTFGPVAADSAQMLAVRVAEVPALETLERASKSGAFAEALRARGRKTGAAIVNVFTHPIDTVSGIPSGVARYFSTKWDLWTGRAQSLADRSSREFENKGDPYHAPPGPMTAARKPAPDDKPDDEEEHNHAWYARTGSEAARETKRYLKYGQQRREMAKVLGVDPNSTNALLNERLDALAWAAVWGNFSAGSALGEIAGPAATVISWSGKLNQYVLEKSPEQLRESNRTRLMNFCRDDFGTRQFLRRGGFTDTLRTALAQSLEKLGPQSGCDELLELAATTRGEVEARYLVDALKLLEREGDAHGGELFVAGAGIAWRTPSGRLLLPLPVDYLSWNTQLAAFFDQHALSASDKVALIGGDASTLAQRELTQRGWSLRPGAPFDGAPAYADGAVAKPVAATTQ